MISSYHDNWVTVYTTDALSGLRELPEKSVHVCVTSPPYWGLRSYLDKEDPKKSLELGAEPTPEEYVERLVEIFREVRRVLRDDGTLWLNLGSSFAGSWGNQGRKAERGTQRPINGPMMQNLKPYPEHDSRTGSWANNHPQFKAKDLVPVPWLVGLALQKDGWWLRADNIWSKPNPMPSSVTDRPSISHEYMLLFSKKPRYFFDSEAVKETAQIHNGNAGTFKRNGSKREKPIVNQGYGTHRPERKDTIQTGTRNIRSVWTIATRPFSGSHYACFPPELVYPCVKAGTPEYGVCNARIKKLKVREDLTPREQAQVTAFLEKRRLA